MIELLAVSVRERKVLNRSFGIVDICAILFVSNKDILYGMYDLKLLNYLHDIRKIVDGFLGLFELEAIGPVSGGF